jgi:hypothetical protein
MAVVRVLATVAAPVARYFDLARDINSHVGSLAHAGASAVAGRTTGR